MQDYCQQWLKFITSDFPSENPRPELLPVLFTKLETKPKQQTIHKPLCRIKTHLIILNFSKN